MTNITENYIKPTNQAYAASSSSGLGSSVVVAADAKKQREAMKQLQAAYISFENSIRVTDAVTKKTIENTALTAFVEANKDKIQRSETSK